MKTILGADYNLDDLFRLERALSLVGIEHRLLTAGDGAEAEPLLDRFEGHNEPLNSSVGGSVYVTMVRTASTGRM